MNNDYINRTEGISMETRYTGDGATLQRAIDDNRAMGPAPLRVLNTKTCTICHKAKPLKGGKNPTNDYGVRYFICKECYASKDT